MTYGSICACPICSGCITFKVMTHGTKYYKCAECDRSFFKMEYDGVEVLSAYFAGEDKMYLVTTGEEYKRNQIFR